MKGDIEDKEEVEGNSYKEQLKKERAERYAQRAREIEEEEEEETEKIEDIVESRMQSKGGSKTKEPKKPHGSKGKVEAIQEQPEKEEEEYEERVEGSSRKRKIGCINAREVEEFQNFIKSKMEDLVNEMKSSKELINPVRKFIRALKLQYDVIRLFENNGTANMEDILGTIPDTKGITWQKALDSKEVVDADEYNKIVDCCIESRLFQEGTLHLKLDEMVFGQETDEAKECIMQKCASLFENVKKAHQANLNVARDLKDLANIVKEPEVFSKIAQTATQPMVACYTPGIDTFIKQQQILVSAKQEKLSKHKSIAELMEMSNLPQYNITWGDRDNKEMAATRYTAVIVWYFMKREMCGMAPNVGNIADSFKVSQSQLSHLLTVKKFKSRPGGYIPKRKRMVMEEEPLGAAGKAESQAQEADNLENYLLNWTRWKSVHKQNCIMWAR